MLMRIIVLNPRGTKKARAYRRAARFYLEALGHTIDTLRGITVRINEKEFVGEYCTYKAIVCPNFDSLSRGRPPKSYTIDINKNVKLRNRSSLMSDLQCIAHECAHIDQYLTGRLIDLFDPHSIKHSLAKWKGRRVKERGSKIDPWEVEAYIMEKKLFRKLDTALRIGKITF